MAKVAKAVGVVAGVVGVLALTASTFGVGGAAAAAVLKTVTSVAAITSVVANTGAQILARKPPAQGSVTQTTIGTSQDACELLGRTYSPGARVHLTGYGAKYKDVQNPYLLAVDVVSVGGPVEALEQCLSDFAPITFSGTAAQGYFGGFLWRSSQVGAQREASALPLRYAGAPGWGANARLSGKAAIAWNALFDAGGKVFSGGFPQVGSVWRGVKAYDPRKDSTYPGGMGSHRWADPSDTAAFDAARATWEYTTSPGLLALRNALGSWERDEPTGGRYRKVFGAGIPIDGLIVEDFVHLANVCDANGWHVGGRIFEPGNRWDNLKRILAAGGAEPAWRCGRLGVKVQAPRIALDTITATDLADDGDVVVGAMQGWEQRLNTLTPKYRSEAHRWEYVPANAIQIASYLAEDGEEKSEERQIDLVQDATQARQLCAYELMDRRELGEIELPCKPRLRRYGPGDLLIVDIPEAGLVAQPAVVLRRSLNPETMGVSLVLRGETLEKHAFALAATGEAPPTPGLRSTEDIDATLSSTNLVDWSQVRDPDGTRPDDNATNSADPDSPFGPGGTVKEAIATLDRVAPIEVKAELLDLIQADQAAAIRQAARDNATLARALLRATDELNRTREVFRDAGVTVNPTTGEVRIYAVDQVADRTSQAEIRLNAVQSSLNLRVTLDQLNEAILKAQLDPSGQVDVDAIFSRLTNVEIGLDGVKATLLLKADATTVTALGGVVTSVSQSLDALAGVVETKASSTAVSGLTERVGSVEQTIRTLGDVSSMSVELRQARIAVGKAGQALLAGVVANEEANQRMVLALSQARQELQTFTTEGLKAEAFARTLLTARVGGTEASLATEIRVRAEQNAAMTQSITEQAARIGDLSGLIVTIQKAQADDKAATATTIDQVRASVAAEQKARTEADAAANKARADGDAANLEVINRVDARVTQTAEAQASNERALGQLIQQVTAGLQGIGQVGIEQSFKALVTQLGDILGVATLAIDTNGNLVGTKLIGAKEGLGSLNLINADLKLGLGRIILRIDGVMLVLGLGFGVARDLMMWFGPSPSNGNVDLCSRANGTFYLSKDGSGYFGGSLIAGALGAGQSSPSLAGDATVDVTPFGSNGRPITYVASWSYRREWTRIYQPTAEGRQAFDQDVATFGGRGDGFSFYGSTSVEHPASTIVLTRSFNGGAYAEIGRRSFTTETLTMSGQAPIPGDAPGRATFTSSIGGSFTVNEPTLSPANRALRLTLSRSFAMPADGTSQRLTITTAEDQA